MRSPVAAATERARRSSGASSVPPPTLSAASEAPSREGASSVSLMAPVPVGRAGVVVEEAYEEVVDPAQMLPQGQESERRA